MSRMCAASSGDDDIARIAIGESLEQVRAERHGGATVA